MRKNFLLFLIIGYFPFLCAFPACAEDLPPIHIGVAAPLSGQSAIHGQQIKKGAEYAANIINNEGGILGHKVELIIADDASDPKQGVAIANKFALSHVAMVIGNYNSNVAIPSSEVLSEAKALQFSYVSNAKYTERGLKNVFRLWGRDEQQADAASSYISKKFLGKRVVLIHDKTTYGKGLVDEIQKDLQKDGLKTVEVISINPNEKDYSALISRLKQLNLDLVYFGGYQGDAALILKQMRDQGVESRFMSGDTLVSLDFPSTVGDPAIGTLFTFIKDPRVSKEAQTLVQEFRAHNIDPDGLVLYAYAALQIFKQAAETVGSLDYDKITTLLHSGHVFYTVAGPISYDKKGDLEHSEFMVYEWNRDQSGRFSYAPLAP
jgi:branched-chain amino acid transport system substrate-binding protein